MDSGMLGVFLKELLRPAPKLQNYGKLMALVRSHPDKLCVSGAGGSGFVSLRNGSCPSLPTLDHEAQSDGQFQSGEQDIDLEEEEEEAVNRSSEEQSPCTLLFELANRYLTRRLGGYKGALGTESREQDANVLAKRFSRSVRNHGILRPEVVLAEIDHACSLRKISEDAQRQAGLIFRCSFSVTRRCIIQYEFSEPAPSCGFLHLIYLIVAQVREGRRVVGLFFLFVKGHA